MSNQVQDSIIVKTMFRGEPIFLSFLEKLYKISLFYHRFVTKPKKVPPFVISIGNLTTGGCGKTEMVLKIAKMLKKRRVCILSRGYKGKYEHKGIVIRSDMKVEDVGDEPLMLSKRISVPILVGKNRVKNAMFAYKNFGVDTIILDDGFQHFALFRNLDILLINGNNPFGNYYLLPYGILREPLSSMKRADIIVITKTSNVNVIDLIRKFNKTSPIFEAYYKPDGFIDENGNSYPLSYVSGKRVLAICGIQDPGSFKKIVEDLGCNVSLLVFPDHHFYSTSDIENIKEKAKGYDVIVSTMKDKERLKGRIKSLFLVVSFSINNELLFMSEISSHFA